MTGIVTSAQHDILTTTTYDFVHFVGGSLLVLVTYTLTLEINNLSSTFDWSQSDVKVNSHIDLIGTLFAHSNTNLDWNCDDGYVKMD
jgi:hypothetical protein